MDLVDAFRWQAQACVDLGSPMYGALLERIADALADTGGPFRSVLLGHEDDIGPSALALRFAGALHRQVLEGEAPALAAYYPSVGGSWDLEKAWPHVVATVEKRSAAIRALLEPAPQTNEVGRSTALLGGLLHIVDRHPLPIRLLEIGCSGGLNLRADRYRYQRADGEGWGPRDSPVVLDPAWQGRPLPASHLEIAERRGSDIAPIDVATLEGRTTLLSYVWPDQRARLARLRGAFEIAAQVPVVLERTDAVRSLTDLRLESGATTVVWHSVMWQYLSDDAQDAVQARIAELAGGAGSRQPFAHLMLEPMRGAPDQDREFLVVLEVWPGGGREVLGTVAPHGVPATWE